MNAPTPIALVTGAGSGIGRGIAIELARYGYCVWLAGRRKERLQETANLMGPIAPSPVVFPADIASESSRIELRTALQGQTLEWVIHCASSMPFGRFLHQQWKEIEDALSANLFGTIALSLLLRPQLKRSAYVLSDSALVPLPLAAVYSATKTALRAWIEIADPNAVPIYPPLTRTELTEPFTRRIGPFSGLLAEPIRTGQKIARDLCAGRDEIRVSLFSRLAAFVRIRERK